MEQIKGMEFSTGSLSDTVGEQLGATPTWEQYGEKFTTVHYISGIPLFDEKLNGKDFSSTTSVFTIVSAEKAIVFILELKTDRFAFAINRSEITGYKITDDTDISVRSVNRIAKSLKVLPGAVMKTIGFISDQFEKVDSITVKGSIFTIEIQQDNKIYRILYSAQTDKDHAATIKTFTQKHISNLTPKKEKEGCYIATLCYGNYDAPEVLVFRKFRDYVLKRYILGRIFIKVYYTLAPQMVKFLSDKKNINNYIKKAILDRIYKMLRQRLKP